MTDALKIGIIGGVGWLGSAIASAMLEAGVTGGENLTLSSRSRNPDRFPGVNWTQDNQALADHSDVIILSVRPDDWRTLEVDAQEKLVISVMAGISLDQLSSRHKTGRVVRSQPNAAAEIGKSFTPWVASKQASETDRAMVKTIFGACGAEDEVASEGDIDYFTALTGSGPAFPALLADAMMQHAIGYGLASELARKAARMVLIGAGGLMEKTDESPTDIVRSFTDYRGTTAAALETMRAEGFDAAVASGLAAGFQKAKAMGGAS
ncbi:MULTISPECIES: pyrroline-5-carboxylate reductase family protein [Brucella]|uniref:Pyrroline-5-carboxylate reductase n=1 Tax=Brucella inopinata TaxID=1218315 RepID=A0AAW7B7V7_9HYPH|nr:MULTISPECIES: pyrroline-5-carboxylate reductase [Brucella]EFM55377.1 pyrroline-5-carboxylate reductase protein [Brucella inopinata BO1]EFM58978.1 pyrroline-5-carboxylate reductase protein [Brucella sp. BO2]MDL2331889.1 pyrroline-5-carboxylate reductase [Brucella inopinata]QGA57912.1 pyrroline-5-carboxylate reductase [Brucella sp. 2280]QPN27652.1 pyrroline-5-carboxylate reductase [Brucella sp. BO2]